MWDVYAKFLDGRIWKQDFLRNGTYHPKYTVSLARWFPNTDYANRLADTAQEEMEVGGDNVNVLQVTGENITIYYSHL
jgi:hypothetical protein